MNEKTVWHMEKGKGLGICSVENHETNKKHNAEMFSWEPIAVNGKPGYFFGAEEERTWRVYWEYKGYICMLKFMDDATMDKETILKIAEGVTIQPKSKK